jgi:hypothetical protein
LFKQTRPEGQLLEELVEKPDRGVYCISETP